MKPALLKNVASVLFVFFNLFGVSLLQIMLIIMLMFSLDCV